MVSAVAVRLYKSTETLLPMYDLTNHALCYHCSFLTATPSKGHRWNCGEIIGNMTGALFLEDFRVV